MTKRNMLKYILLLMLLPLGILLLYTSSQVPEVVEKAYSNAFFKFLGQLISSITGILPFSLAEISLILLVLAILFYIMRTIVRLIKPVDSRLKTVFRFAINILISASIIYFSFVVLWGLNYSRLPFSTIAGLETHPASVNELAEMCESLVIRTSEMRTRVNEDKNGVMALPKGKTEALKRANKGYDNASKTYPQLGGRFGQPKPVLLSELMCYTGITGVYFPFTAEANVNMANNASMVPSTICHEMAHQRGFAREDEANFIAYLTCKAHPDTDFQYSGHLLALLHSTDSLYRYDREKYYQLSAKYGAGVKRDINDINNFWKKYEGPVEKMSTSINNAYLKANMQNDGVYSYGRMVDLLLAEYRIINAQPLK